MVENRKETNIGIMLLRSLPGVILIVWGSLGIYYRQIVISSLKLHTVVNFKGKDAIIAGGSLLAVGVSLLVIGFCEIRKLPERYLIIARIPYWGGLALLCFKIIFS